MSALANCPHCGESLVPRQQPLTKRPAELLEYLRNFIAAKGYAPSFSEIADHFGLRSLSTVHEHLRTLEAKGHITRQYNEARGITLVGPTSDTTVDALRRAGETEVRR